MRAGGTVAPNSIRRYTGRVDFVLEGEGKSIPVTYKEAILCPIVCDKAPALVEGSLSTDGRFVANMFRQNAHPSTRRPREVPVAPQPVQPSVADVNGTGFTWREAGLRGCIGSFALVLALVCAVVRIRWGDHRDSHASSAPGKEYTACGNRHLLLIFLATFSLEYCFSATILQTPTSFHTAIATSRRFTRLRRLWSGQEGSLLYLELPPVDLRFFSIDYLPKQNGS